MKFNISTVISKLFWHFFKTMPCEKILKIKWDEYRFFFNNYSSASFDLSDINKHNKNVLENKTIWLFWNNGIENAPDIVKICFSSIQRYCPKGWNIVLLTEDTVRDYICFPTFIEDLHSQKKMYMANYTDLLRTALLFSYGGIWMDLTCYLTSDIPLDVIDEPLFMFTQRGLLPSTPNIVESWFIRAKKDDYVMKRVLENCFWYFYNIKDKKKFYFYWFYIVASLYRKDSKIRDKIDKMWYCSNVDALLLSVHYGLDYTYSEKLWKQLTYKCFVHKLTYKYNKEIEFNGRENLLNHILRSC